MSAAAIDHPRLLACQYWITILRLLCTLPGAGNSVFFFVYYARYDYGSYYGVGIVVMMVLMLVFWIILALNDLFILTFDFARTDTYIGSIDTQVIVSILTSTLSCTILALGLTSEPALLISGYITLFPLGFTILYSLCLLAIVLRPAIPLRSQTPLWQLRTYNVKDILLGVGVPKNDSRRVRTITGHRREVQVSARDFWRTAGSGIMGFFSRLLFRRVNPVETRAYAFIRNVFATIAILVLATRAVIALIQAQNKFETRMQSRSCIGVGQIEIQFLVKNNTIYDYYGDPNSKVEVAVETDSGLKLCDQALLVANPELTGTRFQVFTCGAQVGTSSSARRIPTYHIKTSSVNGSALLSTDMPRIWLSNRKDSPETSGTLRDGSAVTLVKSAVPLYSPAFELLPGYHLETKAGRMYRRFIKSSMIRDLITMRSDYTQVALFPIIMAGSLPLANATMATATIYATLQSGLTYLRSQDAFWSSQNSWEPDFDACDFIEDYRASTVFDVLGSVGGLFAILEAIHLLLFGRPMLWGIFGTKLISPFGLTGAFSSDTFKRRLREQYHREPTDDNPDTIRVGAFLQDFVIDFGPANPQPKQKILHPLPMLRKRGHVSNRQETIDSQTSLTYTEPPSPSESDRGFDAHKHPFASDNQ